MEKHTSKRFIRDKVCLKIYIDNDVNVIFWGFLFNTDDKVIKLTYITFGTGISVVIVFNKKFIETQLKNVDEKIGHVAIELKWLKCNRGNNWLLGEPYFTKYTTR